MEFDSSTCTVKPRNLSEHLSSIDHKWTRKTKMSVNNPTFPDIVNLLNLLYNNDPDIERTLPTERFGKTQPEMLLSL
jgi:hypothetical protein